MPHQAQGYPPGMQRRLLPFGEAALQHFVYLERPEGMEGTDAEGFDPAGPPPVPMRPEEIIPRGQDFATVGHLYRSIERGLAHLADKLGVDGLFIGPAGTASYSHTAARPGSGSPSASTSWPTSLTASVLLPEQTWWGRWQARYGEQPPT